VGSSVDRLQQDEGANARSAGAAHLWVLESLDKVNRAIQGTDDLGRMMSDVLEVVLHVFACDRAWLLYPCDPSASVWRVPMERTNPAYPGALNEGGALPMFPELSRTMERALASPAPTELTREIMPQIYERYGIRSCLAFALHPKMDQPYMFGLHQCSREREWSAAERRLMQEIGRRLADALSSLTMVSILRASEARLAAAQHVAQVGYWERDYHAGRVTLSDETCRIFGLATEQRSHEIGAWHEHWLSRVHPEDRVRVRDAVSDALERRAIYDVEYRATGPEGELRALHSRGHVSFDADGRPRRMFGTVQDISHLRRTEAELRASEERFRTFVDHATDAFFLHGPDGVIVDVNQQACESMGYSREELIGKSPMHFDAAMSPERMAELGTRLDRGETVSFDTLHRHVGGRTFPVEIRIKPFLSNGKIFRVSLARDITERKRVEDELTARSNLLRAVIEGTSDAVFVKDVEGRYLLINTAGAAFLGRTAHEVFGRTDFELFDRATARGMVEHDGDLLRGHARRTREETATADGVTRCYLTTKDVFRGPDGEVAGLVGISRDITQLKQLEGALRHAQKMEAVGRLAGGIAHDFNNLLTVINGYTSMVLEHLSLESPDRDLLLNIMRGGERAARLTRQLLAFGRKQVLLPEVIDVHARLAELREMLRRLIGEHIELTLEPSSTPGMARVDPGQFEQAVVNLAINARDAMPGGGQLTLSAEVVDLTESDRARFPDAQPGSYVRVSVRDTGCGMDEATRGQIFEPFFTTKAPGAGTGLGLAMVYGFVRQSDGQIEVMSAPQQGTTFRLYLPSAAALQPSPPTPSPPAGPARGHETVLLVEDEAPVRQLFKLALEGAGYRVLEGRDGHHALEVLAMHAGEVHVLVTDVVMPRLNGRQLIERLRATNPGLRLIAMSGYPGGSDRSEPAFEQDVAFLQKPFPTTTLVHLVRRVIDERPSHAGH
ncbi:MAG: PAS domain S-box protein, partial [Candidatus Eisenbacteria bacterium]